VRIAVGGCFGPTNASVLNRSLTWLWDNSLSSTTTFGTGRPDASASLAILAPAAYPMYGLSAVTTPIELTTESYNRSALAVMPATLLDQ
jgi:hypothetical protein